MTKIKNWIGGLLGSKTLLQPKIAVFIDGDAIGHKDAAKVLAYLSLQGRVCIKRVYGNFTSKSAATWSAMIREQGAVVRHMTSVAPGKNATDIALVIEATEMLLTRDIDTFALVTSDADFTPLVWRLRETGKDVLGFGHRGTPRAFRTACTDFREIRVLHKPGQPPELSAPRYSLVPADAAPILVPLVREFCQTQETIEYRHFARMVHMRHPRFDPRIFSRRQIHELLVEHRRC